MQPNGDLEGMEGVVPISTVVILKRRKKLTKILLCNLEASLFACLRSSPSGPQRGPLGSHRPTRCLWRKRS